MKKSIRKKSETRERQDDNCEKVLRLLGMDALLITAAQRDAPANRRFYRQMQADVDQLIEDLQSFKRASRARISAKSGKVIDEIMRIVLEDIGEQVGPPKEQ